jgi:hypothetical protein
MIAPDVAWTPSPSRLGRRRGAPAVAGESRSLLAASIHDFIPALFPDEYFDWPRYRTWYPAPAAP